MAGPDIMQLLQQLQGEVAPGNTPDPRLAAMAQMRGGDQYRGSRGAPEKASPRDRAIFNNSGDAGAEEFVNRFGFGAIDPSNRDTGGVPLPRPREPHLDYNQPLGPALIDPPRAGLRPGRQQAEFDRMQKDPMAVPDADMNDEQMLDKVHEGMGKGQGPNLIDFTGDVEEDRKLLQQDPSPRNQQEFHRLHGEETDHGPL